MYSKQRGNILFLILLAVVLFAALSYAVTSGMRGGGNNASKESAQSAGSAVLQYMTLVRAEVQRLILVNGCTTDNLDWRSSKFVRINGGPIDFAGPITSKAGCAVFSDAGGPVTPQTFEQYQEAGFLDYYAVNNINNWRPGHFAFRWASRINEGTSASDVVMVVSGLRYDVCAYMLTPSNPPAALPTEDFSSGVSAGQAAPTITGTDRIGDDPANLNGEIFAISTLNNSRYQCTLGMVLLTR